MLSTSNQIKIVYIRINFNYFRMKNNDKESFLSSSRWKTNLNRQKSDAYKHKHYSTLTNTFVYQVTSLPPFHINI